MNLVLFEQAELAPSLLPSADPRAQHVLKVLRRAPGDTFEVGVVNGAKGIATLVESTALGLRLDFRWDAAPPPRPSTRLIVALPRPQTARDILRDATTLGVDTIDFVATARSDPNYAGSRLWSDGEWRRHLLAGAAQACDTHVPAITWTRSLDEALADPAHRQGIRLGLDLYETEGEWTAPDKTDTTNEPAEFHIIAIGPERGWDAADRASLRRDGFRLVRLGNRVMRTETAVVAALALINAQRRPA